MDTINARKEFCRYVIAPLVAACLFLLYVVPKLPPAPGGGVPMKPEIVDVIALEHAYFDKIGCEISTSVVLVSVTNNFTTAMLFFVNVSFYDGQEHTYSDQFKIAAGHTREFSVPIIYWHLEDSMMNVTLFAMDNTTACEGSSWNKLYLADEQLNLVCGSPLIADINYRRRLDKNKYKFALCTGDTTEDDHYYTKVVGFECSPKTRSFIVRLNNAEDHVEEFFLYAICRGEQKVMRIFIQPHCRTRRYIFKMSGEVLNTMCVFKLFGIDIHSNSPELFDTTHVGCGAMHDIMGVDSKEMEVTVKDGIQYVAAAVVDIKRGKPSAE